MKNWFSIYAGFWLFLLVVLNVVFAFGLGRTAAMQSIAEYSSLLPAVAQHAAMSARPTFTAAIFAIAWFQTPFSLVFLTTSMLRHANITGMIHSCELAEFPFLAFVKLIGVLAITSALCVWAILTPHGVPGMFEESRVVWLMIELGTLTAFKFWFCAVAISLIVALLIKKIGGRYEQ